jgi:type IV secretion system protein VirB8
VVAHRWLAFLVSRIERTMMFGKNRKDPPNVQKAVAAAASFEVTIGDLARKSERRAWFVSFGSLVMSLMLAGGYYFMLPLKEKVPYVVMADPFSGTASVAVLRDDPFYQSIVANETMARANVANYVTARESFDADLLKARDWAQINVMSSLEQQKAFAAILAETNPSSPAKFVRANQAIRVQISSITSISDGGRVIGATVRVQRNLFDRMSGALQPIDRRLITLSFDYRSNLQLHESLRWLNPMGFVVTQYRSDLDLAATGPGSLDESFNAAMASASALINERDASIFALKVQARAAAAAAAGQPAAPPAEGAGTPPPTDPGATVAEPPNPDATPADVSPVPGTAAPSSNGVPST